MNANDELLHDVDVPLALLANGVIDSMLVHSLIPYMSNSSLKEVFASLPPKEISSSGYATEAFPNTRTHKRKHLPYDYILDVGPKAQAPAS